MARILVVDDEESIRYTFEAFLRCEGHEVLSSRNYDEAIEAVDRNKFDLIFADIILEGRTGIDVLKRVREKGLRCPVVIVTGCPNIESAAESVRLGAFDYISKPLQRAALIEVTSKALRRKAVDDEMERSRSYFEAICRSVGDAVIAVDDGMIVTHMNEAAREVCGISAEDRRKEFNSVQRWCAGSCVAPLMTTIEGRKPATIKGIECRHAKRPGQVVNLAAFPIMAARNEFGGTVMLLRNVSRPGASAGQAEARNQLHGIIGKSPAMHRVYHLIEALADVPTTVLITGESGTGKELVARALHHLGRRAMGRLVKVNCAALSESLLESELFGYVKGAFTGAVKDKVGRFQKADGGTILLDEIGDISPKMQTRLLRVLQESEFDRVGDSTPIRVDARVVVATNANLREKVGLGEFREDLYYRLNVVEVCMPPLRNRREDIPLLTEHFISKFNAKFSKKISSVSSDVMKIFMLYRWPGNVRELEHTLESAFIRCKGAVIVAEDLPDDLRMWSRETLPPSRKGEAERLVILGALEKMHWNKTRAAGLLGISRRTIYRKMVEHGIPASNESE